jgi:transcription termination factor NusB
VIDEAVELAKMFGSEASPKFVNGVLATAVGGPKERST